MKRLLTAVVVIFVLAAGTAQAQQPAGCGAPSGTVDVILSGSQPTLVWAQAAADVIGGFYVQVNTLAASGGTSTGILVARTDIGKPASSGTCTDGSLAYAYRLVAAVPVGFYQARVTPWNLKLDGTRQEGTVATRFFDAALETPLPGTPRNLGVRP